MVADINEIATCVNVNTGHIDLWLYAIGYVFSLISCFFTRGVVIAMHEGVKRTSGKDKISYYNYEWESQIVGYLEAIVYPTVWYLNRPELIVLWVGLKTVAGWKRWNEPVEKDIPGRAIFNIFLVGSSISILFGTVAGKLPSWWGKKEYYLAFLAPIALILGSLLLRWHVSKISSKKV